MPDSPDKPTGNSTDDDERMRRYLEWRERTDRTERAERETTDERSRPPPATVTTAMAMVPATCGRRGSGKNRDEQHEEDRE